MLASISKDFELHPLNVFYTLDVNQTRLASFDSLSGGEVEISVIQHNVVYESGEYVSMAVPGPTRYAPVVLERGYGNTKELYNWFVLANTGKIASARKNVTITLNIPKDGAFVPMVSWNLINAWPSKISGFASDQDNNARLARFSITLIAESIERIDP